MPLPAISLLLTVIGNLNAQAPALKSPVKIESEDLYMNAAWDVGIATVAGQPTEKALRALKEKGYTVVVNFRTPQEMTKLKPTLDEEGLVKELGMKYVPLPLSGPDGDNPDRPEVVEKLAEALNGNEGKTLVHCTVGWRASYVWTAYLYKYRGLTLSEAVRHGQAMEVSSFLERLLGEKISYSGEKKSGGEQNASAITENEWSSIVSPQQALAMKDKGAVYLDVRSNYMEYIDGHLPGAVHMDANSLRGPKKGLPVQYRSDAEMAETIRLAGVSAGKPIVIYANPSDVLNATMTAYVLEKLGTPVSWIVNGGSAEAATAGAIEKPIPVLEAGNFHAARGAHVTATIDDIRKALQDGKTTLIDARPTAQYTGEQKLWVRNGHIPGAINVFWKTLTKDDNAHAFRSRSEIEKIFQDKGIRADQDVIVYCGTSKEATLIWLMLSRELGFKKVRVFEGAWTEYSSRTDLPVATGPNPK